MNNTSNTDCSLPLFKLKTISVDFMQFTAAFYEKCTLNNGAKTADPALPYSNALMSCGRMLNLQNDVGNRSRDDGRLLKKLFFASWS